MSRLLNITINLLISITSVLVFLLVCEFIVFRHIWLASDAPRLDYVNSLVRYAPDQQGVWRVRDEIASPYRINRQGWNSAIGEYILDRRPGVGRIAVVGDSYVEALQVANTSSFAEVMGSALGASGESVEVYRFGISGAPLSQYVQMVEREVVRYKPDWIVVSVVHNDFDESYRFKQGRYTSSFMKFKIEGGKVTGELPPTPWHPSFIEVLRQTATARFFLYRWQVRPQVLIDLFLPRAARASDNRLAANVDIADILADRPGIESVADHAVARLAALTRGIGAHLLLVMDGDRQAIYRGNATSQALTLNRILADAAAKYEIAFLDLNPVFAADWATHHQHFEFSSDGHWNTRGHNIVGAAVAERILNSVEHELPSAPVEGASRSVTRW